MLTSDWFQEGAFTFMQMRQVMLTSDWFREGALTFMQMRQVMLTSDLHRGAQERHTDIMRITSTEWHLKEAQENYVHNLTRGHFKEAWGIMCTTFLGGTLMGHRDNFRGAQGHFKGEYGTI